MTFGLPIRFPLWTLLSAAFARIARISGSDGTDQSEDLSADLGGNLAGKKCSREEIEAVAEDAYSVQMFIVGYKNGRVVASPQTKTPIHYYHGGPYIDLKNGIAGFGTLHMGYEYSQYYKVSNVKFTSLITFQNNAGAALEDDLFYEINGKKVSADKYNKEVKKYSKYDCSSLQIKGGHKLNDKNIDKYIK